MTFRRDLWVDTLAKLSPSPRFARSESPGSASTSGAPTCVESTEPGGGLSWESASGCKVKSCDVLLWDAVRAQLNKRDTCNLAH